MGSIRHLGKIVAWLGGLGAAAWALTLLGRLPWLAVNWGDFRHWLAASELEIVLAALGRLVGLAIIGWIAMSSVLYALARLAGIRAKRLSWLSIGPIRRAVDTVLAGSLMISTLVPGVAVASAHSPNTTEHTSVEAVDPAYVPWPAGRHQPDDSNPHPTDLDDSAGEDPPGDPPPGNSDQGGAVTVIVEPGDHLWGLAQRRVAAVQGHPPTDGEVAAYWVRVVDVNRTTLRSGDADLIFPGEEVLLPEVNPGN
ncbi:hypothetical protein BH23ACT5_BH23ACT5_07340 [soil metagenome]